MVLYSVSISPTNRIGVRPGVVANHSTGGVSTIPGFVHSRWRDGVHCVHLRHDQHFFDNSAFDSSRSSIEADAAWPVTRSSDGELRQSV
jgi:hypothetical protein